MKRDLYKVFFPFKDGKDRIVVGEKIINGNWKEDVSIHNLYKSVGVCDVLFESPFGPRVFQNCLSYTLSLCSDSITQDGYTVHENDVLLYSATDFDYDILVDHFIAEFNEEKREFQLRSLTSGAIEDISFASECNYLGNAYSFPDLKKEGARWLKK